ncbi:MAG: MBL fold metallo-hydrolase, partial [Dermatophilaceae bacterium]
EAYLDGRWQPDPNTADEQALAFLVKGHGLVVLVGCSHPGLINIVRAAQQLTGSSALHAVVGGFHLNVPDATALLPRTIGALRRLSPDWIVPSHCTGWGAHAALAHTFPEQCVPGSVGTRLHFGATT